MTKRFEKNKNGKVEFTEKELKALLDEIYNEGYNNGKYCSGVVWNPPYRYDEWWNKPCITWCSDGNSTTTSSSNVTLDSCNASTTVASSDLCTTTGNVTLNGEDISHLHVK